VNVKSIIVVVYIEHAKIRESVAEVVGYTKNYCMTICSTTIFSIFHAQDKNNLDDYMPFYYEA